MVPELREMVKGLSDEILTLAGNEVRVLYEERAQGLAEKTGADLGEIYRVALMNDIIPYRYIRNGGIISCKDQLRLAESTVAVVVIDIDKFDESNLNRQALCTTPGLGKPKALEAAQKIWEINPAVEVLAHETRLTSANAESLLGGAEVVVDALDSVPDRFVIERAAKQLGIPMVHAGIAGFEGQLMTIYPEDPGLVLVYGDPAEWNKARRTPEMVLGVPAVTAALVATLQAMEVLKILLGKGEPMRNRLLRTDLETGEFHQVMFA